MSNTSAGARYVLDLCDGILGAIGLREHRFDWLRGDPGKHGQGRRLPVDCYWPDLGLVVEYNGTQHERPTVFFDKPHRLTVSGVHRGQQRALYDARRAELIPFHGLRLVIVRPADLACDRTGQLLYHRDQDAAALAALLAPRAA